MRRSLLLAALLTGSFADGASAQAPDPITFEVVDNNRLFARRTKAVIKPAAKQTVGAAATAQPDVPRAIVKREDASDSVRFQADLQTYLRCADKSGKGEKECREYRRVGLVDDRMVPNLRQDDQLLEYATRYDKVAMAYEPEYGTSAKRTLRFSLHEDLMLNASLGQATCHWTLTTVSGEVVDAGSPECAARDLKVSLALDAADRSMSFSGKVEVVLKDANGAELSRHAINVFTRDYLIVALGDSFTSGEGNPERNVTDEMPAQWLDYRCHRSVFSYPVILSQMLSLTDPRHSVTLVHLACSGARSTIGVTRPYRGVLNRQQMDARWEEFDSWLFGASTAFPDAWRKYGTAVNVLDSQVDQARKALTLKNGQVRRPDLVVMSVGVNDMGEVPFLKAIAENDYDAAGMKRAFDRTSNLQDAACIFDTKEPVTEESEKADDAQRLRIGFDCLQQRLVATADVLKAQIAPRDVYLMEYHDPLQDEDGKTCGSTPKQRELLDDFLGNAAVYKQWLGPLFGKGKLTKVELDYAHEAFFKPFIGALNAGAKKAGWRYINSMGEEHKRGFCSVQRSWYHDYRASRSRQGLLPDDDIISTGTLHPNTFGQYYSAVRALNRIRTTQLFGTHNISCVTDRAFAPVGRNPDQTEGLAWHIWNTDHPTEKLSNYHVFRTPNSPCR